jgi:hypothetical protein
MEEYPVIESSSKYRFAPSPRESAMNQAIVITPEDIEKAKNEDFSYTDPIQVALERQGYGKGHMRGTGVTVGSVLIGFPDDVQVKLRMWDETHAMEPFEFEVKITPIPAID